MKTILSIFAACILLVLSQQAFAQDTLQPDPQLCASRDSICKQLRSRLPAGASINFELTADCLITLVAVNGMTISSYDVTTSFSGSMVTTSYRSNGFSTNAFPNYKKGQKIYIENIKAIGADGGSVKIKPVTITW